MIAEILKKNEGRTLEFKENTSSLKTIAKSVIAFANTAGGTIVIGVIDRTKDVIGIENPLEEEERIDSGLADLIAPLLIPEIDVVTFMGKQLMVLNIPYTVGGPYYLKAVGPEKGTYVRFGSTNRIADEETRSALTLAAKRISFDQLPCPEANASVIDWKAGQELFQKVNKELTKARAIDLGMLVTSTQPSNGGVLLFGKNRLKYFPDSEIRCARFDGLDKVTIIDELDMQDYLPHSIESVLKFISRNSRTRIEIGEIFHEKIPQYPVAAVREAVINAIVHADYAMRGVNITIAIFDDRIEITNPGSLPYGMTLDRALAGSSHVRNRVIARVFKELGLIERWGSGLKRIVEKTVSAGLPLPKFEDMDNQFRVTLYGLKQEAVELLDWQEKLVKYLRKHNRITTLKAANLWKTTSRTARSRLADLIDLGLIIRIATSEKDPNAYFVLTYNPMNQLGIEGD